jgi:glutathione S-transferase
MPELKLYSNSGCPFCRKVTSFMASVGIEVDIEDPYSSRAALSAFRDFSGGTQIPCLSIDGKPLLESDDIIIWMEDNLLS